jgi:hypothetical protein
MRSTKPLLILLTGSLILMNVAFYYLFAVNLEGVFIALTYFVAVIFIPGLLIAVMLLHVGCRSAERPTWQLILPLSTIFGIANMLISYLLGQVLYQAAYYYLFAWAYVLILAKPVRASLSSMVLPGAKTNRMQFISKIPVILVFILIMTILFFLVRPTPGIVPLDINPDHVWNAGNTVSLVSHFPLQSMNIEERPNIAYHILIHIAGTHMAIITGLPPHLVGLQYVFVPLVPLLIITMVSVLGHFIKDKQNYLFYGLAVLLFGGGFKVIHEVKVRNMLNSSTNFLGIILLFSFLAVMLQVQKMNKRGRLISLFTGVFLATVAKGSIGATLVAGIVLWTVYRMWQKKLTSEDMVDCIGALAGFAISFLIFYLLPLWGQPLSTNGMAKASFPIVPFSYVTKNDLASPFVELIYKYVPGSYQVPTHILLTVIVLPIFVLLYFSYRLIVLFDVVKNGIEEHHQRLLFIALGSLLIGFGVNMAPQENAYFLTSGMFILDLYFVRYMQKKQILLSLRSYRSQKNVYAFVGALLIFMLPFLSMRGWIRSEHMYNFVMYGRVGQLMDATLSKTMYRKSHQSITPDMYEALTYIRNHTGGDMIVVSPFEDHAYGKHLTFFTSAFSERTAFIEGDAYAGAAREGLAREGLALYVGLPEIMKKRKMVDDIYVNYRVSEEMRKSKYLFLADNRAKDELIKKYSLRTLFENRNWSVLQIAPKNSV